MPVLTNPKHERFAQELAKGKSQAEAYELAGYKPSEPNASRLTRHDKVQARVAELQERAAEKAEWTAADRLKMLHDVAKANLTGGDHRVTVSAIAEANKMQGSHAPAKTDLMSTDGSMSPPSVIQIVPVRPNHDSGADTTS